jgi:hypothetical protein
LVRQATHTSVPLVFPESDGSDSDGEVEGLDDIILQELEVVHLDGDTPWDDVSVFHSDPLPQTSPKKRVRSLDDE